MAYSDKMPTTAKAVSAALMAVIAWYASEMFRPLMPEGTNFGWFNEVNVGLALLCGWVVTGKRLGYGYSDGISAGLTGMGALVFWALFLQSFNEMLRLALDKRYDGPVEGLTDLFEIAVDFGSKMAHWPLLALLVLGGIGVGIIGEWVSHRWS